MKRLRLVKVIVHPIFVLDDGETLTEFPNTPSEIPAAEWEAFPEKLKRDVAEAEAQINGSLLDDQARATGTVNAAD